MNEEPPAIHPDPTATAVDARGTPGTNGDPGAIAAIERAAATAVDQHWAESTRGRGKRGPDKRPRRPRRLSAEKMDPGAGTPFLEEAPPAPLENDWHNDPPPFDEALARSMVDVAIGLLNDGAAAVIRAIAKRETQDDALAAEAAASVRMPEKTEATVKEGAFQCAKKYALPLEYAPEVMLGGGLLIWASQIVVVKTSLVEKGAALRAAAGQYEEAA